MILQEYYTGLIQYFIWNIYSIPHWILYLSMESEDVDMLEKIQHWALSYLFNLPYKEYIQILNL